MHAEPGLPGALEALPDGGWLDACGRCTYNLLLAAADAGAQRVTVLGTMDVFLPYAPDVGVMHNFKPLPTTAPAVLGPHLAEFCGREFALCGATQVARVISDGHFSVQLNHFIPGFLSYSVYLFF